MMLIKRNVTMIGEFTGRGPKLYSEKAAGNTCGCIGFVKDKNTKLNVPNTLLKKDIRDVTAQPTYKVFAVISKHYTDEKYINISKVDKSIDLKECHFSETIENMIDREILYKAVSLWISCFFCAEIDSGFMQMFVRLCSENILMF